MATFTVTFDLNSQESINNSIKELDSIKSYLSSLLVKEDVSKKGLQVKSSKVFVLNADKQQAEAKTTRHGHRGKGKLIRKDVKFYTTENAACVAAGQDKSLVRIIRSTKDKQKFFPVLYFIGTQGDTDHNNNARRCYSQLMSRNYNGWNNTLAASVSSRPVYKLKNK